MFNEKDGSPLVRIPAGEFFMGSDIGYPAERPVHRVSVAAFYLGVVDDPQASMFSFLLLLTFSLGEKEPTGAA